MGLEFGRSLQEIGAIIEFGIKSHDTAIGVIEFTVQLRKFFVAAVKFLEGTQQFFILLP